MAKELGVGVEVYIKWMPDGQIFGGPNPACHEGVITDGPFPPNAYIPFYLPLPRVGWKVRVKGMESRGDALLAEEVLVPKDDWEEPEEEETTAPTEEELCI